MPTIFKYTIQGALDKGDIEDDGNTIVEAVQQFAKDVLRDTDIISIVHTTSGDDVTVIFTTEDEDQSRMIQECLDAEKIPHTFAIEVEDEHDRVVDRRYATFTMAREAGDSANFQDAAHTLHLAQEVMVGEIERVTKERDNLASTIHGVGALTFEGRELYSKLSIRIERLMMSHDRLGEMLAQRDEDTFHEGDGWLTRQVDIWIRG